MFKAELNGEASREAIRRAIAQLSDMTPLFDDVREYMIKATRERFSKGVSPTGQNWAAKKQSTLDHYKRLGYGTFSRLKPLVGPGRRLSREITGEGGYKLYSSANAKGALIGSSLIYSRVMQDGAAKGAFGTDRRGGPIPWGRIPARTWLGVSQEDEREIVAIADEHMGDALSGKS